jgi:hypothetical protein
VIKFIAPNNQFTCPVNGLVKIKSCFDCPFEFYEKWQGAYGNYTCSIDEQNRVTKNSASTYPTPVPEWCKLRSFKKNKMIIKLVLKEG